MPDWGNSLRYEHRRRAACLGTSLPERGGRRAGPDDSAFSVARRLCDGGRRDAAPLGPFWRSGLRVRDEYQHEHEHEYEYDHEQEYEHEYEYEYEYEHEYEYEYEYEYEQERSSDSQYAADGMHPPWPPLLKGELVEHGGGGNHHSFSDARLLCDNGGRKAPPLAPPSEGESEWWTPF